MDNSRGRINGRRKVRGKKLVVYLCLVSLLLAVLAGCGGTADTDDSSDSGKENHADGTKSDGDPDNDIAFGDGANDGQTGNTGDEEGSGSGSFEDVPWLQPPLNITEQDLEGGTMIEFKNPGSKRITYTGNQNAIAYITSPDQLPTVSAEELKKYDADFFRTKALVLIKETVGSGSTRISIQSIKQKDRTVCVTLLHESPEVGTADMATWLLWAEVDLGMEDCQWVLANPALKSALKLR